MHTDVRLNEQSWPIVQAIWPAVTTDDALERYLEFVLERLGRGQRFAVVVNGSFALGMSRGQHRWAAEQLERNRDAMKHLIVMALVVTNPIARLSLHAINALAPPRFPQRVFSSTEQAVRWAELELSLPSRRSSPDPSR